MISILTPTFGQAEWLALCIASVADQKGVAREQIVQEGWPDREIPPRVEGSGDYRLAHYREPDRNMYDALNLALGKASGGIIGTLNSDEQYLPGALEAVEAAFAADPALDVLFGDFVIVDARGMPASYRRSVVPRRDHVRLYHLPVPPCATFYRRRVFDGGLKFDPGVDIIADALFVYQLLGGRIRTRRLGIPLAAFTLTGANLSYEKRAIDQKKRWRETAPWPVRLAGPFLKADYFLRKWRAGAYQGRDCSLALFTLESPDRRVARRVSNLTYRWPSHLEAPAATSR